MKCLYFKLWTVFDFLSGKGITKGIEGWMAFSLLCRSCLHCLLLEVCGKWNLICLRSLPVDPEEKGLQFLSGKRKSIASPRTHSLSIRDGRHTSSHSCVNELTIYAQTTFFREIEYQWIITRRSWLFSRWNASEDSYRPQQ